MTPLTHSAFCKRIIIDELDCLHIQHPKFFAEICLQGAQLTQFTHSSLGEFVWLSPSAQYKKGQGLRGGVPICWPWFGVLDKNPTKISQAVESERNAHGFARTQMWQLQQITESVHGVSIEMTLTESPSTLAIWPFPFELRCLFHFTDELNIELTTLNTGNHPFSFSQALHTYLGIEAIERVRISGAHNHNYIDALDHWQTKQQTNHIQIQQEVDRIYLGEIEYQLFDGKNTLTINSNSASSVVWNPWINKSKTLSQFPHNAYNNMLCIENGNILGDAVTLNKNERHSLTMALKKY
ncbi:MAG: glucose-6-phosphate 1-epimerase [Oceanicoccus sp.]|jgi:glucose-6-phosphate 1-epimerase